ncbi:type IV pilin protein [Candidatus Avelusimicrobium luingense]|uniref:type IV pilin protein n=1 Tax=Candidatus Avelusimicrobium luingense TaxID=3416211 RepID=UPI003D14FFCB
MKEQIPSHLEGFTLIELLVVVLIIGILASVALPQYQKAVEKSKAVQALALLKSVGEAGKVYYLSSGNWPSNLDDLDVDIKIPSWTGNTRVWISNYQNVYAGTDWNIVFSNDSAKNIAVRMERLTGPYRGGSFQWQWSKQNSLTDEQVPLDEILCIEEPVFAKAAGSYCQKIFNGAKTSYPHERVYRLP